MTPLHPSATARAVLALVATVWLCTTVAWAVTGAGYYWPGWVVLSLVTVVLLAGSVLVARRRSERRALTFQVALSVSVGLVVTGVWALTGGDYFLAGLDLPGTGRRPRCARVGGPPVDPETRARAAGTGDHSDRGPSACPRVPGGRAATGRAGPARRRPGPAGVASG